MNRKILMGIIAGVALGILIAPDKGTKTRNKIFKKGNDYAESLNDYVDSLKDNVDGLMDAITKKIHSVEEAAGNLLGLGKLKSSEVGHDVKKMSHN